MSALADIYIKKETLQTILSVLEKGGGNQGKGISVTISINDDSNEYGQNVSSYVSQSKEDREADKKKFYVGNGRVFWENGTIKKGVKPDEQATTSAGVTAGADDDDLPF